VERETAVLFSSKRFTAFRRHAPPLSKASLLFRPKLHQNMYGELILQLHPVAQINNLPLNDHSADSLEETLTPSKISSGLKL
jgi:hypothetical protein